MKKTIGIVGYRNSQQNSFGIGITYAQYFSEFGNVRIIMPWENLTDVDLLVLPGGADLNPASYGEEPGFRTGDSDVHKQHFYDNKLKLYVENKTPIYGICLGFQMLNTYFGGKLVQHLMNHTSSSDRYKAGHKINQCTPEGRVISKGKIEVNSHHHQAVPLDGLGKGLIPLYLAQEEEANNTAIVECFRHKSLPIGGVQWHSEEWFDNISEDLINSLLEYKQNVLA
jgi:putative glutamine amidotransferase